MIIYESAATVNLKVILDGKHVGNIKELDGGYTYYPKGSKNHGEVFNSLREVKATL